MTLMLASVGDADEAEIAAAAGVDVIEIENPLADPRDIAMAVAGRRRLSAVLGDPRPDIAAFAARVAALRAIGVDDFKLAVDTSVLDALESAPSGLMGAAAWSGVLMADRPLNLDLLPRLAAMNFRGAGLDTSNGRLTAHLDSASIAAFRARCRQHGLLCSLSGALEPPDVPRLLMTRPDTLAFDGALRVGHARSGALDAQAIRLIRDLIPREGEAARPAPDIGEGLDQIFVRDYVIPARIGAYGHERGVEQRVRFNVHADIRRARAAVDDMRAIVSYDLILDAIRLVVGRGHCKFVETLAEEVAALTLEHPRVVRARVRVEKLDIINGAVGVEIRRERAGRST